MFKKPITLALMLLLAVCVIAYGKISFDYKVSGLSGDIKDNVNARLDVEKKYYETDLTSKSIKELYKVGPKAIRKAMRPYGYFDPKIDGKLEHDNSKWLAKYHITPGKPMKISKVSVTITGPGKDNPAFKHYLANFPIKVGDTVNAQDYNSAKKVFFSIANRQGYLTAKLDTHKLTINLVKHTATVTISFETGPRYYFGPVTFSPSPFKSSFLQRYVRFQPGQAYSSTELLNLQQVLNASGYFSTVTVKPQQEKAVNNQVPIDVTTVPVKKKQYTVGLGYGTDTGIRGTLGITLPWVTSTGQHFQALLLGSKVYNNLDARYTIPGKSPANESYFISGGFGQETPPNDSHGVLAKVTGGYVRKFTHWQQTLSLSYQVEHYNIRGGPYQTTYIILPSASWTHSSFDDPVFPLKGNSFNISVRGTVQSPISNTTFLQGSLSDKLIYSLSKNNRFVFRGNVGYTLINSLDNLPLSLQFFAGGSESIRGYGYQDIGPGRSLYVGSAEYQRRIWHKWYATAFYDAGNVTEHIFCRSGDTNCGIKQSPGVGIMWASPIGPLELTAAQAISEPDRPIRIEFSMGTFV